MKKSKSLPPFYFWALLCWGLFSSYSYAQEPSSLTPSAEQSTAPSSSSDIFIEEKEEAVLQKEEDPLEPLNRSIYQFNSTLDRYIIEPVARAYRSYMPSPIQNGVGNFFNNIQEVYTAAHHVLQAKPQEAFINVTRIGLNSTFGLYGLIDVASLMGIEPLPERDLGQTLAYWGLPSGPYLVLPFLGPSSLRDMSDPLLTLTHPMWSPERLNEKDGVKVLAIVHQRAQLLEVTQALDQMALDSYVVVRQAYMLQREQKIRDNKRSIFDFEHLQNKETQP